MSTDITITPVANGDATQQPVQPPVKRTRKKSATRKGRKRTSKPIPEAPEGGFKEVLTLDYFKQGLPKVASFADPAQYHETAVAYFNSAIQYHERKKNDLLALGDASVRAAAVTADTKMDDAMSAITALLANNPQLAAAMAEKLQKAQMALLQVEAPATPPAA